MEKPSIITNPQLSSKMQSFNALILGIETSCDETGVALYGDQGLIGHLVYSQIGLHVPYGGVVPELASRDHLRKLLPLVDELLHKHARALHDLTGIAYTAGPGLAGALLIGASFAESLAASLHIPAFPIHHLEGHLLSPLLAEPAPDFPFIALLVSGGHTQLMRVSGVGKYELLGETVDDAAGEAFDKAAMLLGFDYPGGAKLSKLAQTGNAKRFDLPRPMLHEKNVDFSFSGLKTAVSLLIKREVLDEKTKADIAASFEAAVIDVLVKKSIMALDETGLTRLVVAGGVSANQHLRKLLNQAGEKKGFTIYFPSLELSTDNGAMIAFAGFLRRHIIPPQNHHIKIHPRWPLSSLSATAT